MQLWITKEVLDKNDFSLIKIWGWHFAYEANQILLMIAVLHSFTFICCLILTLFFFCWVIISQNNVSLVCRAKEKKKTLLLSALWLSCCEVRTVTWSVLYIVRNSITFYIEVNFPECEYLSDQRHKHALYWVVWSSGVNLGSNRCCL